MQYKKIYQKECLVCGTPFECGRRDKECCSPECTYKIKRQRSMEYNRRMAAKRRLEKEMLQITGNKESLAEFNAKARAAGMSYGQYDLAIRLGRVANG